MRHFLHPFLVLPFSDALNEVHCIDDLFFCLAIVVKHQKRSLAPLRLDDVPRFLDRVQFATLRRQEHLLELIVEELSHCSGLVHL